MLKDYFDSALTFKQQCILNHYLEVEIPNHCVFSTYGQARSFRNMSDSKRENGRYDFCIFCYDGFYYVSDRRVLRGLKYLIAKFQRGEE